MDIPEARLTAEITALRGEMARCDSKAALLLALTGAGLLAVGAAAVDRHLPVAAEIPGALGGVLLLAATLIQLTAVRPALSGPGWPTWPEISDADLRQAITAGPSLDEVLYLARAARRKFRWYRIAVDCTRAGLALLTLAVVLARLL